MLNPIYNSPAQQAISLGPNSWATFEPNNVGPSTIGNSPQLLTRKDEKRAAIYLITKLRVTVIHFYPSSAFTISFLRKTPN